jgi:hypothetical protein
MGPWDDGLVVCRSPYPVFQHSTIPLFHLVMKEYSLKRVLTTTNYLNFQMFITFSETLSQPRHQ